VKKCGKDSWERLIETEEARLNARFEGLIKSDARQALTPNQSAQGMRRPPNAALPACAAPQSSQNADVGAFFDSHFEQRRGSALPMWRRTSCPRCFCSRNFVQRVALSPRESDRTPFVSTGVARRPARRGRTTALLFGSGAPKLLFATAVVASVLWRPVKVDTKSPNSLTFT
jgi:hypothetical protein